MISGMPGIQDDMDGSEEVVYQYLAARGFTDVVYEPDGQVPPDFLVNGRIAIAPPGSATDDGYALPRWR